MTGTVTHKRPDANAPHDFKFFTDKKFPLKAYTKVVKNAKGEDETEYYLEAPASSTVIDRMDDVISIKAQKKMEAAVKEMTIWLNHSYEVPEDIFGTCEKSEVVPATDIKQGECFDLIIRVKCYVANQRVMDTWQAVAAGVKLGFSVGGYIPDGGYEFKETPDGGYVFIINDFELFEVSVVGIPANQRAIIDDVVKGFRKRFEQERAQKGAGATRTDRTEEQIAADLAARAAAGAAAGDGAVEKTAHRITFTLGGPALAKVDVDRYKTLVEAFIKSDHEVLAIESTADVTVKAIPVAAQKTIRGAMDNLHKAVAHGVCSDANTSVGAAHEALKTLLPASEDEGAEQEPGGVAQSAQLLIEAHQKKVLQERGEAANVIAAQKAEADTLTKTLKQKRDELAELEAKIATAGATPLSRKTKQFVSAGESQGAEQTADPERRRQATASVTARLSRKLTGQATETSDARTSSIP
jgi:hypothetical protein